MRPMGSEFECIAIEKGEGTSAILGHAGFIKTVEDLYEVWWVQFLA
jgi:adenosine/AMP kinase